MASKSRKRTSGEGPEQFKDLREPLFQLKDRLKSLMDGSARLYHAVLFSPSLTRAELALPISNLEPLIDKKLVDPILQDLFPGELLVKPRTIVEEISLATPSCGFHGHFFISEDGAIFEEFTRALSGIYNWLQEIRDSRLVSWINVPENPTGEIRDLIHWVSLVYHYGYEKETHHLMVNQHFWMDATDFRTQLWSECPILSSHGQGWLTYQPGKSFDNKTRDILESYTQQEFDPPEVIEMYLEKDLIGSSLSVIDVILYQLPTERARKKIIDKDVKEWRLGEKVWQLPNLKKKKSKTVDELKSVIQAIQRLYGWGKDDDPRFKVPEEWRDYWTQKDVANCLGWRNARTGKVNASKISRKFDDIFGTTYDDLYTRLHRSSLEGLKLFLDRRRIDVEEAIKHFELPEKAGPKRNVKSKPLHSRKKLNLKSKENESPQDIANE